MNQIKLGVMPALSHSWHKNSDSWLVVRAIKSLAMGIKAFFGGYSISAVDKSTAKLMEKHPDSWFSKILHKPLTAYKIRIPSACKGSTRYISDKVNKLDHEGRKLKVKLAFKEDGSVAAIPMYFTDNSWLPANLNCTVRRSQDDTKAPGEEIACSDFSWAYATKVFGRGKDTFATIATKEKIKSMFANTTAHGFMESYFYHGDKSDTPHTKRYHYGDGYYFHQGHLSKALTGLVRKYWNIPNGTEKNFYFRSKDDGKIGHAMALRLKKQEGCMKVIFYDPNDTLRHKTILLSEPGLAAHITEENLAPGTIFDGGFINIDDRKSSIDECDVQCFGGSPTGLRVNLAPGHSNHQRFKTSSVRGIGGR